METVLSILLYTFIIIFMTFASKWAFINKFEGKSYLLKGIITIFPALVAAMRESTGTDSQMYINSYYHLQEVAISRTNGFEIGYSLIVKLMNAFSLPHQFFFFFMNFVTILCFVGFIENEKDNIDIRFSTFLFFINYYLLSFNAMRQGLAIAMDLYAYSQYEKKKYLKFLILVLLSSTIHISGLMALAIVPCDFAFKWWKILYKLKKTITFSGIILGIFLVFNRKILASLVALITNIDYAQYILADLGKKSNPIYFVVMNVIPFLCVLIGYFNLPDKKIYNNYYILTIAGYILTMLSLVTGTQGDRIGLNFQCLNLATLSNSIVLKTTIKAGNRRILIKKQDKKILLYIFFAIIYSFNWFYKKNGGLVPYVPITKI